MAIRATDNAAEGRGRGSLARHFHSIRTRLTVLLTLVVTIVYGTVAFIEVNEKSAQIKDELLEQIHALLMVQVDALSVPLWNFDQDEVERQLGVLVTHGDILAASVIGTDREAFAQAIAVDDEEYVSRGSAGPIWDAGGQRWRLDLPTVHTIKHDVRHNGLEPIGQLIIAVSEERVAKIRAEFTWNYIREFLIVSLVITITMAISVTNLVKPVLQITRAMDDVAGGNIQVGIPATERRDEIGQMARALQVFKANAEQLKVALERERELNGLQRQFVSMVSHEFRTPLAVIDGNAQRLLRRPERNAELVISSMQKVRNAVTSLTELMESVLNAARLEEGRIAFDPQICGVRGMLKELCGSYAELNLDRHLHVDLDRLPETTVADRKLLRQVFSNLLSNALKYSPDGKNIWITGRLDDGGNLVVAIRDEGVGIPTDELNKLFGRFFRASTSTGIAGSGIGLHLVKHFLDLHKGTIEVDSGIGEGTTFTVRIPHVRPREETAADAA